MSPCLGHLRYDAVRKGFDRFDIVALGNYAKWEDAEVNGVPCRYNPFILGVAFSLTSDTPAERLPPFHIYDPGGTPQTYWVSKGRP